jgi:hypothetical protein
VAKIQGATMKMLREELTTEGAMRVLKGLGGATFRTDEVLVLCSNKAEETRVTETALGLQRSGYVGRIVDAKSPVEFWVVIAFKQPGCMEQLAQTVAAIDNGVALRHARHVGAAAI